jgi:hypothetical protein
MAEIVDQLSAGLKIESDEEFEEKEDDSCAREMQVTYSPGCCLNY